jgi:hypothetical protein
MNHFHLRIERPGNETKTLTRAFTGQIAATRAAGQYAQSSAENTFTNGTWSKHNNAWLVVGRDKVTDRLAALEVTIVTCGIHHSQVDPENAEVEADGLRSEDYYYHEHLWPLIQQAQVSDQTAERCEQPGTNRLALQRSLRRAIFRLDGLMEHGQHSWSAEGICTVCGYDGNS